jgi:ABC-type amino acid transport system permease subunit
VNLLYTYAEAFARGITMTLFVTGCAWIIGTILGFFLGTTAVRSSIAGSVISKVAFGIGAIPAMILMVWFHYPVQSALGVVINPIVTTIFVLTLINTALVAEAFSSARANTGRQYLESAFVHGLDFRTARYRIELPLLIRSAAPRVLYAQVLVLHVSLFASLISLNELFSVAQRINAVEYQPIPIYTFVALFYFLLSLPLLILGSRLERLYGRDFSER